MKIGQRIKQRRLELGWSMRELAQKMEYANQSTIARIEKGEIDIPQTKIVQFSKVLGVTVAYLMSWEEVQKNNDALADIVVRLRTDDDFLSVVEMLYTQDAEKIAGVKQMLSAFLK